MKRLQFIILSLTMLCTGLVLATIESQANDPPGISIDINYDVVAENDVENFECTTVEGVFAVYSCNLTLWPEVEYSIVQNSDIINNITRISVLNKGSTDNSHLYTYTLRLNDPTGYHTVNDYRMPMKASCGKQVLPYS